MKLDIVINIFVDHPIFAIILAFIVGTAIFAILGMSGWAVLCFIASIVVAIIAIVVESNK